MKSSDWWIIWLTLSALFAVVMNRLTASPILDFSPGHLVISGIFGGAITLLCFAIVTVVRFLSSILRDFRRDNDDV